MPKGYLYSHSRVAITLLSNKVKADKKGTVVPRHLLLRSKQTIYGYIESSACEQVVSGFASFFVYL